MAPLITPAHGKLIMPPSTNNISAAVGAIIATRAIPDDSDQSNTDGNKTTMIILFTFFGFAILASFFLGFTGRITSGFAPRRMPSGHVYGNNAAGSRALNRLRSGRRLERPNRQQAEDHASNGPESTGQNAVARPTPVITRHSDRQEESPPPPACKQL